VENALSRRSSGPSSSMTIGMASAAPRCRMRRQGGSQRHRRRVNAMQCGHVRRALFKGCRCETWAKRCRTRFGRRQKTCARAHSLLAECTRCLPSYDGSFSALLSTLPCRECQKRGVEVKEKTKGEAHSNKMRGMA
jgi:hypothetical protein